MSVKRARPQSNAKKIALAIVKRRYSQKSPYKISQKRNIYPGNYAKTRKGFSSVARTRGAAVTGEMKYFDCYLEEAVIGNTSTLWSTTENDPVSTVNLGDAQVATPLCLFSPKSSAALNGRVGRQVYVYKLKINFAVTRSALSQISTPVEFQPVRVLIVLDKQTNASQLNAEDVMNDVGGANHSLPNLLTFQNPDGFGRFKVLADYFIIDEDPNQIFLSDGSLNVNGKITIHKFIHKFKTPLLVHFNATNGGTVADIVDNSLHVIAGKSVVATNEWAPRLTYYSRVSYKECC